MIKDTINFPFFIQTPAKYWKCYNLLNILERSATAEILDSIIKYKITYETNYHNLINFYKNVIFLNGFCKVNAIAINWIACRHNHQIGRAHV